MFLLKKSSCAALLSLALLAVCAPSALASFGFHQVESILVNQDGSPDIQAGSHPFSINTTIKLNERQQSDGLQIPDGDLKDLQVKLPPGLVGSATALPKCTTEQFHTPNPHIPLSGADCPQDTQIGVARVELNLAEEIGKPPSPLYLGVYNLVPPPGVPAAFGFNPTGLGVVLTARVRTGGDYGITVDSNNDSEANRIYGVTTTLWGVPYDHSHDGQRGECLGIGGASLGSCPAEQTAKPFLTMPTSCSSPPLTTTFYADSWQNPVQSLELEGVRAEAFNHDSEGDPVGVSGCELLDFSPQVSVRPETSAAASPSGLDFELSLPQNENPVGLAEGDLRNAVVTLPQGVMVSPSSGDGLGACTDTPEPGRPGGQIALESGEPVLCPDSSKVGTVTIETPLLETPLTGSVYVAQPGANKYGSLLALYIVAEGDGVLIKLPAHVEANPETGQLTTVVQDAPQQPFSRMKLHFFGGPRAALMTPQSCGAYHATSQLTPWSSPTQTALGIDSPFSIASNCGGGFAPTLTAGTTSNQAGAFSPLITTISRTDQDQNISTISLRTPPGLLGMLSKVTLCGEPQAREGNCPAASQIGHVTASAGAGPTPLQLPLAGRAQDPVYLTGPTPPAEGLNPPGGSQFSGAPFGLSIVVPAEAGPFNLGNVITRAAITIDPHTAQVTISSDPLPAFLQGIPLDVRNVNVTVDRQGFIFNPTNCHSFSLPATITSTQGALATPASSFQAANCATLPFKPKFTVSTQGHTSKADGASLHVHVTTREGPQLNQHASIEANIAKVDVQLPLALPSRLSTLQKACAAAQFESNPAGCPQGSFVGTATANTPVLNAALTGPAILVSHGGAAFPDLVIVLEGEGVRIDLTGETRITKGITYSKFETVPDAPVSSFDLTLPEGAHSVLGSYIKGGGTSFCDLKKTITVVERITKHVHGHTEHVTVKVKKTKPASLEMPTTITGQNGAVIHQDTKISVTGCPKPKVTSKPKKAK